MTFLKLKCPVQHYAWGEKCTEGNYPFIAQFLGEDASDLPWAELWMGAHPKASSCLENGAALNQAIAAQPLKMLGHEGNLRFLLKVLCCSSPLSIQSHPDKATAVRLHALYPDEFPDDNHKPEVLWALSPFRVLAGFRPIQEVIADFNAKKCLAHWARLLSETGDYSALCRSIFDGDTPSFENMELDSSNERDALFAELWKAYPGDSGTFFAYLLNYIRLAPGQAVFVPANTPHAYIEGRGVECMACSDNVIRAGLTPKSKRKDLLMETLDFAPSSPAFMLARNSAQTGFRLDASPDFSLTIIKGGQNIMFPKSAPAIVCMLAGTAELSCKEGRLNAKAGEVFFKTADTEMPSLAANTMDTLIAIAEE